MQMKNFGLIVSLLLLFVLPRMGLADEELTARGKLTNARGLALGNAMVACAAGTSAVWHNPAGITSAMMYTFDLGYGYEHKDSGHQLQLNLLDMKSNRYIGSGIGFIYENARIDGKTYHLTHLRQGIAVPLADNLFSLGATVMYTNQQSGGKKLISQFSMDVGLMIRPLDWLSIGFAAQNLIVGDHKATMPRTVSTGIAISSLEWGINVMFDASFNLSAEDIKKTVNYAVAVEYLVRQMVPLRLAYRYESLTGQQVIAAGVGYRNAKGIVGVDVSYQHHFKTPQNDIVSSSLSLYF